MKIVVLDGFTENPGDLSWEQLEQLGDCTVYDRTPSDLVLERIDHADIVLTNKTVLSKDVINRSPHLKYIGVLATGYNIVDLKAAREKNIPVCNIPTYGTNAVAQFAMALLLELCHHVGEHSQSVMNGEWSHSPDFCYWKYPLTELSGKTMGIIGFGRIGRRTAELAAVFGMKVIAYDPFQDCAKNTADFQYVSLEELFSQSDVISLHCPLSDSTREIICKENIAKMKYGVWIINTSRGPLIRESDLRDALVCGKVAGAALDVVSVEPIAEDNPLLNAPNCIITPHIAWAPKESRQRLMDIAVKNVKAFIGGNPTNVVNLSRN